MDENGLSLLIGGYGPKPNALDNFSDDKIILKLI